MTIPNSLWSLSSRDRGAWTIFSSVILPTLPHPSVPLWHERNLRVTVFGRIQHPTSRFLACVTGCRRISRTERVLWRLVGRSLQLGLVRHPFSSPIHCSLPAKEESARSLADLETSSLSLSLVLGSEAMYQLSKRRRSPIRQ